MSSSKLSTQDMYQDSNMKLCDNSLDDYSDIISREKSTCQNNQQTQILSISPTIRSCISEQIVDTKNEVFRVNDNFSIKYEPKSHFDTFTPFFTKECDLSDLPCAAELAKDFTTANQVLTNKNFFMDSIVGKEVNNFIKQESKINMNIKKKTSCKKGRPKRDPSEGWPKRPLSAYNIFFKEYRSKLLGVDELEVESNRIEINEPFRKKRKKHGIISFSDLAKTIGKKWNEMSSEEKIGYQDKAKITMIKYKEELKIFHSKRSEKVEKNKIRN